MKKIFQLLMACFTLVMAASCESYDYNDFDEDYYAQVSDSIHRLYKVNISNPNDSVMSYLKSKGYADITTNISVIEQSDETRTTTKKSGNVTVKQQEYVALYTGTPISNGKGYYCAIKGASRVVVVVDYVASGNKVLATAKSSSIRLAPDVKVGAFTVTYKTVADAGKDALEELTKARDLVIVTDQSVYDYADYQFANYWGVKTKGDKNKLTSMEVAYYDDGSYNKSPKKTTYSDTTDKTISKSGGTRIVSVKVTYNFTYFSLTSATFSEKSFADSDTIVVKRSDLSVVR